MLGTLSAQLAWSVYDETTTKAVGNTTDSFSITVPAGKSATLVATNFVPINWSTGAAAEAYITVNFKVSGGVSNIAGGTRAVGFGLYNNNGTETNYADDKGYFTWLNGRATGSLVELRRRNGDGSSPSLLQPTGTAFNSLGTGTKVFTSGAMTDGNSYSIQMHLMSRNPGVSFGNTSSTTTGAGIWVSGDGLSQTAYTNPDNPAATLIFNEIGFMFYNSTTADVTLTLNSVTGLTAVNPPTIAAQPVALSLNPGQSNALSVGIKGTAPLTYQWKKDGVALANSNVASLPLNNVTSADAGSYTVTVTNAYGTATSSAATVTVTSSPIPATIITQPVGVTVNAGQPASFTVTSYGSAPISYQWNKDGTAITGATNASFSLDAVAVSDAGNYTVVVSNGQKSVTSDVAALLVNTMPAFTTQPQSQTVTVGQKVTLTAEASGSPAPGYQWQRNGVNIAGATSATYVINEMKLSDSGVYTVRAVNSVGAATSTAASVLVPSTISATAFGPVNGAKEVNTDALLRVTFDKTPVPGNTGRIRIYNAADNTLVDTIDMGVRPYTRNIGTQSVQYIFYPIIVNGNTATIHPHAGVLGYGKTYYVTMEPGVIQDSTGAAFMGVTAAGTWTFSTKAAGPAADAKSLTVAADGSADFDTVQGAIDFVPLGNTQPVLITVKKGVYTEMNYVGSQKPFITVQGEDRAGTVIQYANNANFNTLTGNNRALFSCDSSDFTLRTITLRNLTPKGGSQAEAFRGNGLRHVLDRVNLYSLQDTLMINGNSCSAFITDSYIEGDVDFMWGTGAVYFQRCELKALNPGYYVQVRNGQTGKGHVYVDCKFTGLDAAAGTYLARIDPTPGNFPYSQVVLVNCAVGSHVAPVGWLLNNATTSSTVQFWEYKSTDLSGATLDISKRAAFSKQLDDATALQYRDPSVVLGGWVPAIAPTVDGTSSIQTVQLGGKLTLSVAANGSPQPAIQWYKDGVALPGATSSTYVIPKAIASSAGVYTVKLTSSSGSTSATVATVQLSHAKYYGSYFGSYGSGGSFALLVRDDGTGVFLGTESSTGALVARTVSVDAQGAVTGKPLAANGSSYALAATLDNTGKVTGTLTGASALKLNGTRASDTGVAASFAGFHQINSNGNSGAVSLIVSADGKAFGVTQVGGVFDAGLGTVDDIGRVLVTTSGKQSLQALIGTSGSSNMAVLSDVKGQVTAFTGSGDDQSSQQRFRAFAARARSGAGDKVVIVGFIITGDTPQEVLVRAMGPTLTDLKVSGAMAKPKLDLYRNGTLIATNTGWANGGNASDLNTATAAAGAYPFATTSADSAIHMTLPPGVYSAMASGADGNSGVSMVEVFDLSLGAAGQRLADLSVRAQTGTNDDTVIAGMIVSGKAPKRMLVRGVGPSLATGGLKGALAKPVLYIHQEGRLVAQVTGVSDPAAVALACAESGVPALPADSGDAVVVLNLAPGLYTVQLASADGNQGIGLVEIYELP